MKKKASFGSLAKYGLMLGISLIIINLTRTIAASHLPSFFGFIISLLYLGVCIFFLYIAFKDAAENVFPENCKFIRLFKVGLLIGVIAGALMFVYRFIDTTVIRPEFYAAEVEKSIEILENMVEDAPEQMLNILTIMNTPIVLSIISFFWTFIGTTIISLFIAPFFKKKPTPANAENEENEEQ